MGTRQSRMFWNADSILGACGAATVRSRGGILQNRVTLSAGRNKDGVL